MTRFLSLILLISACIVAGAYAGADYGLFPFPSFLWATEIFLLLSNAAIFYVLYGRAAGPAFTQLYLFSIFSKICFFIVFILFVIVLDKPDTGANVCLFLLSYVSFTIVEVALLFRKINATGTSQKIK